MPNYADQLRAVDMAEQKLIAKRFRLIEKAAKSDNPTDMIAAAQTIDKMQHKPQENAKAYFIDPLQFSANLGYKDKMFSLTYTTLRRMAKTPIINSIIKTRKNQIADFAEPQADRYNTGFVIANRTTPLTIDFDLITYVESNFPDKYFIRYQGRQAEMPSSVSTLCDRGVFSFSLPPPLIFQVLSFGTARSSCFR